MMKPIGTLRPVHSKAIARSKIGVGFECLEREMWEDTPDLYRLAGASGTKHARVQTGWFRCEREKGTYDFAWLEAIVDKLREQGIQPWFNLGYGNKHYCTESGSDDCAGYPPIADEAARTGWCNYVKALVRHFAGKVTHYEIWNEADCSGFWLRGPNCDEYMELVKLTSPVIRASDARAKVIGGAIGRSIALQYAFDIILNYLEQGIARHIDAFTYHRYHIMPELNRSSDNRLLRKLFDEHGGAHVELWQGESGCPSVPSTIEALANTPVTETIQAKVALRSIVTDLAFGVDYTCYFTLSDFKYYYRNGLIPKPTYFGLLTTDAPPRAKPAFYAFQNLCTLFDDQTELAEDLKVDIELDPFPEEERFTFQELKIRLHTATFRRHGWPLIAYWEAADLIPEVAGNPPYQVRELLLQLWTAGKPLQRPVVIDPATGELFEPETVTVHSARRLELGPAPLKDYPMILTDYAAISELICT